MEKYVLIITSGKSLDKIIVFSRLEGINAKRKSIYARISNIGSFMQQSSKMSITNY